MAPKGRHLPSNQNTATNPNCNVYSQLSLCIQGVIYLTFRTAENKKMTLRECVLFMVSQSVVVGCPAPQLHLYSKAMPMFGPRTILQDESNKDETNGLPCKNQVFS